MNNYIIVAFFLIILWNGSPDPADIGDRDVRRGLAFVNGLMAVTAIVCLIVGLS